MLQQLKQDSSPPVSASDSLAAEMSSPSSLNPLSKHEQHAQEWQSNQALQEEFTTQEVYMAYRQAEAMGLVKIIGTGI